LYFGADTKNQRTRDSINVINYIYENFEYVDISDYIKNSFEEYKKYYDKNVFLYKTTTIPILELQELSNYNFPLKQNSSNLLETKFYALNTLSSKIQKNNKIGVFHIYYDNKILCSMDIILTNNLEQNSWIYYFSKILKSWNNSFSY